MSSASVVQSYCRREQEQAASGPSRTRKAERRVSAVDEQMSKEARR